MGPVSGGKPNPMLHDVAGRLEHDAIVRSAGPSRYGTRLQRCFALVGVAAGLLLAVAPGVVMWRRYRRWRTGQVPTPGIAGPLGALVVWCAIGVCAALVTGMAVGAAILAFIGLLPSLVVSARG